MPISDIDLAIVTVFLITTLTFGLVKGRGVKSIREYAVGNKNFSNFVLTSTVFASIAGGSLMFGTASKGFSVGLIYILVVVGESISYFLAGILIGPRITQFAEKISVGEIVGKNYGKNGRLLTGILGFLYCIGAIALQVSAIGHSFNVFLNIPFAKGALIGFGIVVIYSTFGGIRSVTFTDVFQFIIVVAVIPLITVEALMHAGGFNGIYTFLKTDYPTHINPLQNISLLKEYIPLFFLFSIPEISPMSIQRCLMARNGSQAKKAFVKSAFFTCLFACLVLLIGMCALKMNSKLESSLAFPYIVKSIMPVGLMGVAIAGLLAAIMSSADSFLNSGSIALVHDFIKPIVGNKLSNKNELRLTRLTTLLIGALSVIMAIKYKDDILKLALAAISFWFPILSTVIIGTFMGYKAKKVRFWCAIIATFICMLAWDNFITPKYEIDSLMPATIVNALIFFGIKNILKVFFSPFVWVLQKIDSLRKADFEDIRLKTIIKIKRYFSNFFNVRTAIPRITDYCKISERAQGDIGKLLGLFIMVYCMVPQLFVNYEPKHDTLWFVIRQISAFACVFLIFKDTLKTRFTKYSGILYYTALIIGLPLHSSFLYLDTAGAHNAFVNLIFSLTILAFFLEARNYIVAIVLGYFLGCFIFLSTQSFDYSSLAFINDSNVKSTSFFIVGSFIFGYLFSRTKSIRQKKILASAESMAGIVAHELRTPLASLSLESNMLKETVKVIDEGKEILREAKIINKEFEEDYLEGAKLLLDTKEQKLANTEKLIDIVLHNVKQKHTLNEFPVKLSIKDCVEEAVKTYPYANLAKDPKCITVNIINNFEFLGTKSLVVHVMYNLLKNAFKAIKLSNKHEILIYTDKKFGQNCLVIHDFGIGIPENKISKVTEKFASYWQNGTGLGLAFCKDAMKAMDGYIDIESKEKNHTKVILSFPLFRAKKLIKKQPSLRKFPKNICLLDSDPDFVMELHNSLKNRIDFSSLTIQLDSTQALREMNDIYYKKPSSNQISAVVASPSQGDSFFTYLQDRRIKRIWLTDGEQELEDNPYVNVKIDKNSKNLIDLLVDELNWPLKK